MTYLYPIPNSNVSVGIPNARTLVLSTAYQATDPTKAAMVSVTVQATSSISLGGAVNNEGSLVIGPSNTVAAGTGTASTYKNDLGGTLVIGLNMSSQQANTYAAVIPIGWWFAVRQTSGVGISVLSAFDQSLSM